MSDKQKEKEITVYFFVNGRPNSQPQKASATISGILNIIECNDNKFE